MITRRDSRDLTQPGYQRSTVPDSGPTRYEVSSNYISFVGSGTTTGDMDFLNGSDGLIAYILLSWRVNGVTPTVPGGTDIGGGTQSSGADWHSRLYKVTLGPSLTVEVTWSAPTEFIASTLCLGTSGEDFVTVQANASSTTAANAGGTVTTGLANAFLAHSNTGGRTWTEPAGFNLATAQMSEDPSFGSHYAAEAPPTSGAHNATLNTAAKTATAIICANA